MSRALFDAKTFGDFWKLMVFVVVTTLATGLLAITIGNVTFGSTQDYKAVFTDVTGVNKGDDVRIAGVKVGSVKGIDLDNAGHDAVVTFSVASDQKLASVTNATIKYRNLIGQRYIALTKEMTSSSGSLEPGQTIPVKQTHPALDLTVLLNGFKPLFQALSPNDINQLSYEIVQVFQGEGGTLDSLLAHTASLTQTLADKDQVINSLINNLTTVLDHVGKREKELSSLIVTFRQFVHGLTQDKDTILGSLDQISALSQQTSGLVTQIKDPAISDLKYLNSFSTNVAKDRQKLDDELQIEPIKLNKIGRTASYGSWFNFYLCGLQGNLTAIPGTSPVHLKPFSTGSKRCDLG